MEPVVEAYRFSGFVVGSSLSPHGPFTFEQDESAAMVKTVHAGGADFGLTFDDATGDAYVGERAKLASRSNTRRGNH